MQTLPARDFEVIVVADGCRDGTEAALAALRVPFALRVLAQPNAGAAAARNRGAGVARGRLLLFLDDDVIAEPGLVAAHARAHDHEPGRERAAVGPYLLDPPAPGAFLQEQLYRFWRGTFDAMGAPGHRPHYRDVLSGNLSLPAATFTRVGGFDPVFPACGTEDYELGVRLLDAGVPVVLVPDARARHLETTDLERSLRRNRRGGSAEVVLARLHPRVLPELRLARPDPVAQRLAFGAPQAGDRLAEAALRLMRVAERRGWRRAWRWLYARTRRYWYWRGAADELGDVAALRRLLGGGVPTAAPPTPRRPGASRS